MAQVDIDKMSIDLRATYKILGMYDYKAPYGVDNTAFNHYLHALLQYIGCEFSEPVKIEYKTNGKVTTKIKPKWQVITSHTARRTFITNNALRGFSDAEIRRASGHKTASAMDKYVCWAS